MPGRLAGESAPDYGETLIRRANELRLHEDRGWHVLVHYKKALRGHTSLIDDPKFFLSPAGRRDPRAELEATIRAFVSPAREGEKHAACRFIARYHWLKEKLSIDESLLAVKGCAEIEENVNRINPVSATLVFPSSHINSPASMFGHTFIMIETANQSKLLAHAVNYTAVTRDTFGPLFSLKAIFGLYRGYFGILPYYAKIQEYNDFDQRDIWEYRIGFTEAEVRRMLYHIYELHDIYSDYYFFDENCSYNLLFLLDVARPGLTLSDEYYPPWFSWVIPLDTIRGVRRTGIISSYDYRPSRVSTIRYLESILSEPGKDLALEVIRKKKAPEAIAASSLPSVEKVRVCDMVTEYVRYQYSRGDITRSDYAESFIKTLGVRSSLENTEAAKYQVPVPPRPEDGHLSARVALGAGVRERSPFQEVRLRPAYHTIMDNDEGYVEGSHIVFTDITARFYDKEKEFSLQRFDAIDIISITPNDRFIQSISWKAGTGLRRRYFTDDEHRLLWFLNTAGGSAWKVPVLGLVYAMAEVELEAGGTLEHNFTAGAGASLGTLTKVTARWKAHVGVKDVYYFLGEKQHEASAFLAQRVRLGANSSVMLELKYTAAAETALDGRRGQGEAVLNGNLFF